MKGKYDALVIGAGHNGLVAAGYLARNGLSTLVLERSDRVGGACVTRELIPGFKLSTGAQVLGMLRQRIIDDLELERHGLRYHLREPEVFVPFPTAGTSSSMPMPSGPCRASRASRPRTPRPTRVTRHIPAASPGC